MTRYAMLPTVTSLVVNWRERMSKAPKATEARDVMLSELLICVQAAPEADRHKLLAAVRTFIGEHTERKTSLSRFMSHLIAPAPAPGEAVGAETAAPETKPAAKAKAAPAKARAKAKKKQADLAP
jgi:hypothetical protein